MSIFFAATEWSARVRFGVKRLLHKARGSRVFKKALKSLGFLGLLGLYALGLGFVGPRVAGAWAATSVPSARWPSLPPIPQGVGAAPLQDQATLQAYLAAVEALFAKWEQEHPGVIAPGPKGKWALKVDTRWGPGHSTPKLLIRAVLAALERRGIPPAQVYLVDAHHSALRASKLAPLLSQPRETFHGARVWAWDQHEERAWDAAWYYESPLPSLDHYAYWFARSYSQASHYEVLSRRSYLPVFLMFEVDGWINLPVLSYHPSLGTWGAVLNATLANVSNAERFFKKPEVGARAAAEIAVIPELRRRWCFSIISLDAFQYHGGMQYDARYTASQPLVLLASDPGLLDAYLAAVLHATRAQEGLPPAGQLLGPYLQYLEQLRRPVPQG